MSIKELVVRINGDDSGLQKALNDAQKGLGDTVKKADALADSLKKTGAGMSLWVTTPILALGAAAVKSSSDMEMLEASFTTMLGSAKDAAGLMDKIKKMGAQTPFEVSDLASATKTLLQFGIAQENVLPTLKMLGDVSQGNSEKLKSLSVVFGQIQSTGRLMGGDLLQLINAGFNPLQEISKTTGISVAELKKQMEAGAISADMVTESFKRATSDGGQFNGGMETASKTLAGLASTMKDDLLTAGRGLVESLMPILKDVTSSISGIAQAFSGLDDNTKKTVLVFAGLAAAIGPILVGTGQLITTLGTVKTALAGLSLASGGPVALAVIGLAALAGAFAGAYAGADKAKKEYAEFQKVLKGESTGDAARDLEIVNKKLEENTARMVQAEKAAKSRGKAGASAAEAVKKTLAAENAELLIQKDRIVSSMRAKAQDAQAQDYVSEALEKTKNALDKVNQAGEKLTTQNKASITVEEEKKEAIQQTTEALVIGMEDGTDAMASLNQAVLDSGDTFGILKSTVVPELIELESVGIMPVTDGMAELGKVVAASGDKFGLFGGKAENVLEETTKDTNEYADAIKEAEKNLKGLDKNGIASLEALGRKMKEQRDAADLTAKAFGDIGKGLLEVTGKATLDGLKKIGEAIGKGGDVGKAAADSIEDLGRAILNALPNLFLQAGLALIGTPATFPIGVALLAASGVSAVVAGLAAGTKGGATAQDTMSAVQSAQNEANTREELQNAQNRYNATVNFRTKETGEKETRLSYLMSAGLLSELDFLKQTTEMRRNDADALRREYETSGTIFGGEYDTARALQILTGFENKAKGAEGFLEEYAKSRGIEKFASGTNFAPGGLSLVGESGPELAMLERGSPVIPNHKLAGAAGGSVFNFYSPTALDIGEAKRQFIRAQRDVAFAGGM